MNKSKSFIPKSSSSLFTQIISSTEKDVENAIIRSNGNGSLEDLFALLSPAAAPYLEIMAQKSMEITNRRFGKTIQLFIPLYLSNKCANICTYCGYSATNKVSRITINNEETLLKEISAIKQLGFDHVLVLTGESPKEVGMSYFRRMLPIICSNFSSVSLEIQPLEENEYKEMVDIGVDGVIVYQETYDRAIYSKCHPKGKKSDFDYRLDTPERIGNAGMYRIGLGALFGLTEWRSEAALVGSHLQYLRERHWRSRFSVSFPRLRPASGVSVSEVTVTNSNFVQLITAFRLFDENIEIPLSTRETSFIRDSLIGLGITSMSAGSKTNPGGYSATDSLEQFKIDDCRSPSEVAQVIISKGYTPVWKDWDSEIRTNDNAFLQVNL